MPTQQTQGREAAGGPPSLQEEMPSASLPPVDIDMTSQQQEITRRLAWWEVKYGTTATLTPPDADGITKLLVGSDGPSLCHVADRKSVFRSLLDGEENTANGVKPRQALLAAMALYRTHADLTGSIETNPCCLPPLDFIVTVLASEETGPAEAIFANIILQEGNTHHVYQMTPEERGQLVNALKPHAVNPQTVPFVLDTMKSFNIKGSEVGATSTVSPPPPPIEPPSL